MWDIIDKVEFGEKLAVKMSLEEKREFSFFSVVLLSYIKVEVHPKLKTSWLRSGVHATSHFG